MATATAIRARTWLTAVAVIVATLAACSRSPDAASPVERVILRLSSNQKTTEGVVTVETTSAVGTWKVEEIRGSSREIIREGILSNEALSAIRSLNDAHCWLKLRSKSTSQKCVAYLEVYTRDRLLKTEVSAASLREISSALHCDAVIWEVFYDCLTVAKMYWFRLLGGPGGEEEQP